MRLRQVDIDGRHTGGGAGRGILKPFLVLSVQGLEARALARQCQYHLSFIAPGTVRHETAITIVGHRPLCVYCKRSNTGGGNGLGTRLQMCCVPKAKAAMSFWLTVAWR